MKRRSFITSCFSFLGFSALFPARSVSQSASADLSQPVVLFAKPDPSKMIRFNFSGTLLDIDNFDESIFSTIDRLGVKDIEVTDAGFIRLLDKLRLNKENIFVYSDSIFVWSKCLVRDSGTCVDVSVIVRVVSGDVAKKRRLTDNHMFLQFGEKVYDPNTKLVV